MLRIVRRQTSCRPGEDLEEQVRAPVASEQARLMATETAHRGGVLSGARSVVIVRALPGLGDILCAVPAWRALRAALPGSHIAVLGLSSAAPLLERFRCYIDELIPFVGYPGIVESATRDPAAIVEALAAVQRRKFDVAIQMHGSGLVTNQLTVLLGAKRVAGFYLPGQMRPDPVSFAEYPARQPEVRRNLRLAAHLGAPDMGEHLELPLSVDDVRAGPELLGRLGLVPHTYACLHPGATLARRMWPPRRFALVADHLAGLGYRVVLTGSGGDAVANSAVAAASPHVIDAAGLTSVGTLGILLGAARIVVTNDTGASHLAAAVRTPSVVVFTASEPGRWAPLDLSLHRVVSWPLLEPRTPACVESRCLRDGCVAVDGDVGNEAPAVADVIAAVDQLLADTTPGRCSPGGPSPLPSHSC